jgi:hypothetical protein
MASRTEQITSQCLRAILSDMTIGSAIGDSPEFQRALFGLEYFLPAILAEIHTEWIGESLDGIYPHIAQKIGQGEAKIIGLCRLISDQMLVPIHLQLQLSAATDEISWLELRLGEKGPSGMVRIPDSNSLSFDKRLHVLTQNVNTIEWAYKVTFGERRV